MSFSTQGFLADQGLVIEQELLEKYAELFEFTIKCSDISIKITGLFSNANNKQQISANLLFSRAVSHFQAAIILAKNGFSVESLVLSRGILETVFTLGAISTGAVTAADLLSQDLNSRKKHANALLKKIHIPVVGAHYREDLTRFIKKNMDSSELTLYDLADKSGMLAVYDGLYRHLSHHAAHPSISSMEQFIVDTPDGESHVEFQRGFSKIPAALIAACHGILLVCSAYEHAVTTTAEINTAINGCLQNFEEISTRYRPWQNI